MERIIKFRAWDNKEKTMITKGCIGSGSGSQLIIIEWGGGLSLCNAFGLPDGTNPTFDEPVTERFILMQFTGLPDKNGTEVYEGDIICGYLSGGQKVLHEIVWNEDAAKFDTKFIQGNLSDILPNNFSGLTKSWLIEYDKIVIGNIYENPDLLK